jgi:DNA-binding response OmpR family regulator
MFKILIIDDEIKLRENLSEFFKTVGYEVCEAQDGNDGIEKVNLIVPDLIICDLMMPKFDGYDFMKKLKDTNHPNIPVVFLTAKTELAQLEKGLKLGAKACVIKPFSFKELKSIVDSYVLPKP